MVGPPWKAVRDAGTDAPCHAMTAAPASHSPWRNGVGDLGLGHHGVAAHRVEGHLGHGEPRPSLSRVASATTSTRSGLRRKSMWKLVVTDRVTGPIWPTMTIQAAQSARAISVGPETVPPAGCRAGRWSGADGRSWR